MDADAVWILARELPFLERQGALIAFLRRFNRASGNILLWQTS
jgi:hypothetical protein